MKTTYNSEYLPLQSVYIKPVSNAFVSKDLLSKQWKDLNYLSLPNYENAIKEYEVFENSLKASNVKTYHFPLDNDLSIDSIYCRDAAIATDFGMIICNMGKQGRLK